MATKRCQHSTTVLITAKPSINEDSCVIAPDDVWLLNILLVCTVRLSRSMEPFLERLPPKRNQSIFFLSKYRRFRSCFA